MIWQFDKERHDQLRTSVPGSWVSLLPQYFRVYGKTPDSGGGHEIFSEPTWRTWIVWCGRTYRWWPKQPEGAKK